MKIINGCVVCGLEAVIFAADDHMEEYGRNLKSPELGVIFWVEACLRGILDRDFGQYVRLFSKKHNLPPLAIIAAHGFGYFGKWFYCDNDREKNLQNWIRKQDGKFACLGILCCNTDALTPKSKKSLLLIADRNVRAIRGEEDALFSLISPTQGEIDSYTIDYEIKQLLQK